MFQWRRGSTFTLGLRVKTGAVSGNEVVSCWLKKAINGKSPGDDVDPAAVLTTTFVAASGELAAHWLFVGTPEQSIDLAPGQYVADARIGIAGSIIQTDPVLIEVVERVTEGG
jgi:hypothetical protein